RSFGVALDLSKLVLAAMGIFVMAFGWWLLALVFAHGYDKPNWPGNYKVEASKIGGNAWEMFKRDRDRWNLMYEAAGVGGENEKWQIEDRAKTEEEYEAAKKACDLASQKLSNEQIDALVKEGKLEAAAAEALKRVYDPVSQLERGPKPYLDANRARLW